MARGDTNRNNNSSYEEARKLRLEENKKRFEESKYFTGHLPKMSSCVMWTFLLLLKILDLGLLSLSKSLAEATKSAKKSSPTLKTSNKSLEAVEVRRSSRARSTVVTYSDEVDMDFRRPRKRSKSGSWTSYLARPVDEVNFASYEARIYAKQCAEEFQSNLQSGHPSFVKSMVRSHVYSCFWLGLPVDFCQDHLPSDNVTFVLVDENGAEYDSIYKGEKRGLSGGWRGFALDHKLDDGDALLFELTEPDRFKVYIFKASALYTKEADKNSKKKAKSKKR